MPGKKPLSVMTPRRSGLSMLSELPVRSVLSVISGALRPRDIFVSSGVETGETVMFGLSDTGVTDMSRVLLPIGTLPLEAVNVTCGAGPL